MKWSVAAKTFAVRSLRCTTLVGPAVLGPYRAAGVQTDCSGAAAGERFAAGAVIGQDNHSGIVAGQCNG